MNNYKKYNLGLGWISFIIASVVYILTTEPSASFWDCSEFIATSYKLEVGHPPGAPLFMMISRFFAIFAPGKEYAAFAINIMSCIASGLTIMFLFWTITHLSRKLYRKSITELTSGETLSIMAAGFVGAMAYTFSDTFWFSAVEAEVYALSSLFTAMVFWAILKWEDVADEPHANRWLVLIAYLMGLSIGVHLLNLLALPAMVFVYYFKKYDKITKAGVLYATAISFAIIIFVLYMIIPWTAAVGGLFDRLFVNGLGLPLNSGFLFFVLGLFVLLAFGIYITHKKGRVILNTILLMTTVVLLGYSSYASVIIRASVNPPMNSNDPSNPYGMMRLLGREQYGDTPLIRGPYYNSPAINYKYGKTFYVTDKNKYGSYIGTVGVEYDPDFIFFFPRMHSNKPEHIEAYKRWADIKGRPVRYGDETLMIPTFGENLRYFFGYQLNFMYWRYFMWNFVGRQSDVQSTGEITNGNWMSGIKAIDGLYLGPQDNIPSELANNKGRNTYFFLPFLLGLIGLVYQFNRDKKNFTVVMWLFFMTGIAIILYLNQGPAEPRERDYAYAGSFYAFAIWIGLGVLWVYELLAKALKNTRTAAIAAGVVCTGVPLLLAAQNWDDHNRSRRYVARDFGYNYLVSTLPNSIVMNFGDNDTFPLWYNQEVEEVRPDVRIMNLSYLGADWYIDQMKLKYNESAAVPFSLPREKYLGTNEMLRVEDLFAKPVEIKQVIEWIKSEDPRTKATTVGDKKVDFIPARKLAIPVNKQNAIESGILRAEDIDLAEDTIYLEIKKNIIDRSEMMLLDLLANFDWKRPLFFTQPGSLISLGIGDYLQFDGFTYRLTPIKTPYKSFFTAGRIDVDYMYDNLMNKFRYGNMKDTTTYADTYIQNTFSSVQMRSSFARLAKELVARGEKEKALEVLNRGVSEAPFSHILPTYYSTVPVIEAYYLAGDSATANRIFTDYANILKEYVTYYMSFPANKRDMVMNELRERATYLYEMYNLAVTFRQDALAKELDEYFNRVGLV